MDDTDIQAVDTPAPDANVTEEVVETPKVDEADPSPAVSDADESSKPKGVGKRIDELTRLRRDAERERDHWREMAMRNPQAPQKDSKPQESHQPKTLADFEFDEAKYQAHLRTELTEEARKAARDELSQERTKQSQEQRQTAFHGRETKFAEGNPDYLEVTRNPDVPITAQMAEVIAESEDGPALAYHLAKNVEIAESIARLPALAQARELGRIEARLSFERERVAEARKQASKAPPPTPTISATDAAPSLKTTDASGDAMTDEEWIKAEEKRLRAIRNLRKTR